MNLQGNVNQIMSTLGRVNKGPSQATINAAKNYGASLMNNQKQLGQQIEQHQAKQKAFNEKYPVQNKGQSLYQAKLDKAAQSLSDQYSAGTSQIESFNKLLNTLGVK